MVHVDQEDRFGSAAPLRTARTTSSRLGLTRDADGADASPGFALWLYAESCDDAFERLRAAGAEVIDEPADQPWGERVAQVRDPNGIEVIIGSPPPA